ncbi:hypothetical protein CPC08DRAFT_715004 [Agrocybe pediades]|nr:hypothetical protein CPC08DRAFT_715004 [Agrocybe pediades]
MSTRWKRSYKAATTRSGHRRITKGHIMTLGRQSPVWCDVLAYKDTQLVPTGHHPSTQNIPRGSPKGYKTSDSANQPFAVFKARKCNNLYRIIISIRYIEQRKHLSAQQASSRRNSDGMSR